MGSKKIISKHTLNYPFNLQINSLYIFYLFLIEIVQFRNNPTDSFIAYTQLSQKKSC